MHIKSKYGIATKACVDWKGTVCHFFWGGRKVTARTDHKPLMILLFKKNLADYPARPHLMLLIDYRNVIRVYNISTWKGSICVNCRIYRL